MSTSGTKRPAEAMANDAEEQEAEAQEVFVAVELVDFAEFPILDKHATLEIENLESEQPILRIGEFTLYGAYEDAVGTDIFYDTKVENKTPNAATLHHMTKRLKFTIAPKDAEQFHKKTMRVP
ncbi:hypothetical protein THRCLA_21141 [Thraustotheca clavata]|uniref:Transcription factor TFIIIC triple barrel domain-containing protein n=1 Tax=Thraustotheca clavata TaxID=74557 RepID=A0A1V9ZZU4_9STRA|nr:hypothetical protein THRCLA_21141 [Thraustotheca clavata]